MRAAPLRDKFGGLERHVIHPCPGSSRSSQLPLWVKPGQAGAARAKRGKREVLLAAPVLWLLPSQTRRTISIVDDVNLLSPQTRTNLPLPLGPLTTSDIGGLEGEAESSCGHPREAMNLFLARRISRRNRTASLVQHAVSTHLGHKRRWLLARCISRKVSLVFLSSPPWVRFPGIVSRVNERRTGCFMPTRLSGGRVTTPEGCPENPQRERLEQVGRHPHQTCRLALRTKDPEGPGSN